MLCAIDAQMLVLAILMVALGVGPGLVALSSRRARTPRLELGRARPAYRHLYFGAATAARW